MDMHMDGGMMMYFHFGVEETILFKGWQTTSWQGMLGSCVAVFVMAALYEGFKVGREYLLGKHRGSTPPGETSGLLDAQAENTTWQRAVCNRGHFLQTALHLLQVIVSYFLMLIFMTYNAWLCIALVLGASTGYFAFSWKRKVILDQNEHCH